MNAGPVDVVLNGRPFRVRGIFSAGSLDEAVDLDGASILPYDVESMARIELVDDQIVADENDIRIPGRDVILAPLRNLEIQVPNDNDATVSVVLSMPEFSYKEARGAIMSYLEQSGKPAHYGLAGVAYRGVRTRQESIAGLIDLIMPLLIAALTVLNTMRGSVYERRDEIEVYNAVGIPPRYIFSIFFAEAFVYAVVGSVLGYLLSQGLGRILTVLELTGGLNMTFTSMTTIYASLAVMGAVFASTYFPARSAASIARPAEEAGWDLPEPEGNRMAFVLPFTFSARDRMAVLLFLERLLLEHGEGGSGRFHSADPSYFVEAKQCEEGGREVTPGLHAALWLKPFDHGVSQQLYVRMPLMEETGEYQASVELVRFSGTREAWVRLNRVLVAELRRHFLHWRAVPEEDRQTMFAEARERIAYDAGMA